MVYYNNNIMRVTTKKATGVLARLLANIDEKEMTRTRKRMMIAAKIEDAMKRRENELQKTIEFND